MELMSVCESRWKYGFSSSSPSCSCICIPLSILSHSPPTLPNQSVFDSNSWSCVNPARKRGKENGNVPVVNPKWFIAARLAKLRIGHIIYSTVMLIAERESPPLIISLVHVTRTWFPPIIRHSKILGLIGLARPPTRWCWWVYIRAYSNTSK